MKQHPLSMLFPAMPADELAALAADIKANGLQQPIFMCDGMVLDGWHRYLACQMVGVKCREEKYSGKDPVGFVRSRNWHRRHMTPSQRALTEVGLREWAPTGRPRETLTNVQVLTNAEMAQEAGTSERSIVDAKQVEKHGAEVLKDAVKDKAISVRKAAKIAKEPKSKQRKALKEAKAPKPKKEKVAFDPAKCPNRDTCEVVQELAEVREKLDDAVDMLKTEDAVLGAQPAIEMNKLREELRYVTRRRDELMARTVEMEKQIKGWRKTAEKLGWKPEKRAT